ncbi:MAG: hypothetical protein QG670_2774 [Thermoproteota archaeon]|nr:hypothetical protein [Thermoproteota archaeon]
MQNLQHHYYLSYKPPEEEAERATIEKKLVSLRCTKLHYSFWRVPQNEVRKVFETVRENHPLILKRSREIIAPQISFDKGIFDLGSVAIIAYTLSKKEMGKRVAVQRALRKTPRIRIGQSLYLIPYLKAAKLEMYKKKVMLQDDLFDFLRKKRVDAHRLTHLKIVYPSSHKELVKSMADLEAIICQKLALSLKKLAAEITKTPAEELLKLKKILSAYNVMYRTVNGVVFFLNEIMNIDLRNNLKKAYNYLILCKKRYYAKLTYSTV